MEGERKAIFHTLRCVVNIPSGTNGFRGGEVCYQNGKMLDDYFLRKVKKTN